MSQSESSGGDGVPRLLIFGLMAVIVVFGLALVATVLSSVLDHARTDFSNPWLWASTGIGVFAVVVAALMGIVERPSRRDLWTYIAAMVLMVAVGVTGMVLHVLSDLTSQWVLVGSGSSAAPRHWPHCCSPIWA